MNLRVTVNSATHGRRPTHVMDPLALSPLSSLSSPGSLLSLFLFLLDLGSGRGSSAPHGDRASPIPFPSPSFL